MIFWIVRPNANRQEWLYDEGEDATKTIYVSKMEELEKYGAPIRQRLLDELETKRQAEEKARREKEEAERKIREETERKAKEAEEVKRAAEASRKLAEAREAEAKEAEQPLTNGDTPMDESETTT